MEFNKQQLKVINHKNGNCSVIASAGSGKSTTLVCRVKNLIENHGVKPNEILCISFMNKSKSDLIEKLKELLPNDYKNISVDTFHSLGYKIIKAVDGNKYSLFEPEWKIDKLLTDIVIKELRLLRDINDVPLADIKLFMSIQKSKLLSPNKVVSHEVGLKSLNEKFRVINDLKLIYELYEKYKTNENLIDFDDMIWNAHKILKNLKEHETVEIMKDYKYFMIDEFQDTSKSQIEMIQMISHLKNVMVVGDVKQTVYNWRGADYQFLLNFNDYFPDADTIYLNTNYRSTDEIINFSNKFARILPETKVLGYEEPVGVKGLSGNDINIFKYNNEFCESTSIAEIIKDFIDFHNYKPSDVMIISRTNAMLCRFEVALNNLNIKTTGSRFFNLYEIKTILSYLELSLDSKNDDAFEYIVNKPNRYITRKFTDDLKYKSRAQSSVFGNGVAGMFNVVDYILPNYKKHTKGIFEIMEVIEHISNTNVINVSKHIEYLRRRLKLDIFLNQKNTTIDGTTSETSENIDILFELAKDFKNIKSFLEYIDSQKKLDNSDGVVLTTVHKSKGLESPIVFVVGINDGVFPHEKNNNFFEECRLFYVAISRSIEKLTITSSSTYNNKKVNDSIFLRYLKRHEN